MRFLAVTLLSMLMLGACSEQKSDTLAEAKEVNFSDLSFDEQLASIVHDTETVGQVDGAVAP